MLTSQVKGATITQYLDGKLMWSDVLSAEYKNEVKQDLYFGVSKWNGDDDLYFDGCIDDVRIYNRILSESEIQQLYAK